MLMACTNLLWRSPGDQILSFCARYTPSSCALDCIVSAADHDLYHLVLMSHTTGGRPALRRSTEAEDLTTFSLSPCLRRVVRVWLVLWGSLINGSFHPPFSFAATGAGSTQRSSRKRAGQRSFTDVGGFSLIRVAGPQRIPSLIGRPGDA